MNKASLDDTDLTLLQLLKDEPRLPVAELARRASVARGTAQARLDRLEGSGVIRGYGPMLDRTAIGYEVLAFATLQIDQGHDDAIIAHLQKIPQVLEVHAVTGAGDLLCKLVAQTNEHLHEVLQLILAAPGIRRTESHLALHTRIQRSEVDLVLADYAPGDRDR